MGFYPISDGYTSPSCYKMVLVKSSLSGKKKPMIKVVQLWLILIEKYQASCDLEKGSFEVVKFVVKI